jgi:hypothetical protein
MLSRALALKIPADVPILTVKGEAEMTEITVQVCEHGFLKGRCGAKRCSLKPGSLSNK